MTDSTRRRTSPAAPTRAPRARTADVTSAGKPAPAAAKRPARAAAGSAPAAPAPPAPPLGLTLRMPFLTVTIGPQPAPPAAPGGPGPVGTLEKAAFYGGVAALGALGVLEWPVAAAVAAGTWVAQHTRPGLRAPADRTPADRTPAPAADGNGQPALAARPGG